MPKILNFLMKVTSFLYHRMNYSKPYESNSYIVYKDGGLKVPLNVESANCIWIDNDNFVNYSYDQDAKRYNKNQHLCDRKIQLSITIHIQNQLIIK